MYRFLLKPCNKDTKRKSLRHSLRVGFINLGTSNDSFVKTFLKLVSALKSSCLLRDGFHLAVNKASKLLRFLPSFREVGKVLYKRECSLLPARCLAIIHFRQNYVLTNVLQN